MYIFTILTYCLIDLWYACILSAKHPLEWLPVFPTAVSLHESSGLIAQHCLGRDHACICASKHAARWNNTYNIKHSNARFVHAPQQLMPALNKQ